jgi:hypothetical protein
VAVESRPGQGACFRVWLPLAEGSTAAIRACGCQVEVRIGNAIVRQLVGEALVAAGYLPSADGQVVDGEAVAAVVDDDGAALAALRARRPGLPVVLLGGAPERADHRTVVLAMPVDPAELVAALRRLSG